MYGCSASPFSWIGGRVRNILLWMIRRKKQKIVCILKQREQSLIAQVEKTLNELDQISYPVVLLLLCRTSIREKLCEGREMLHQSHSMTVERIRQEEQDKRQQINELQSHVRVHSLFQPFSSLSYSKKRILSEKRSRRNESKCKTSLPELKRSNDLSKVVFILSLSSLTIFRTGGGNRRGVLEYCRPGTREWNYEENACRIWFVSLFRSQTQWNTLLWCHSSENGNF